MSAISEWPRYTILGGPNGAGKSTTFTRLTELRGGGRGTGGNRRPAGGLNLGVALLGRTAIPTHCLGLVLGVAGTTPPRATRSATCPAPPPTGVAGDLGVEGGGRGAAPLRTGDEVEGPVELVHLVEEHVGVEGVRLRNSVPGKPGAGDHAPASQQGTGAAAASVPSLSNTAPVGNAFQSGALPARGRQHPGSRGGGARSGSKNRDCSSGQDVARPGKAPHALSARGAVSQGLAPAPGDPARVSPQLRPQCDGRCQPAPPRAPSC